MPRPNGAPRRYNHDEIARLYTAGWVASAISAQIGCDKSMVFYVAAKRGLPKRGGHMGGVTRSYDYDKILRLVAEGKSHAQIAAVIGCARQLVSYVKRRTGTKTPAKKRREVPKGERVRLAKEAGIYQTRHSLKRADDKWRALLALPNVLG